MRYEDQYGFTMAAIRRRDKDRQESVGLDVLWYFAVVVVDCVVSSRRKTHICTVPNQKNELANHKTLLIDSKMLHKNFNVVYQEQIVHHGEKERGRSECSPLYVSQANCGYPRCEFKKVWLTVHEEALLGGKVPLGS